RNDTQFLDIVPDRRIVLSYRMTMGPKILSACLATVELLPSSNGTLLTYTEQGAYFDGVDQAKGHEEGCRQLLERLALELQGALWGADVGWAKARSKRTSLSTRTAQRRAHALRTAASSTANAWARRCNVQFARPHKWPAPIARQRRA